MFCKLFMSFFPFLSHPYQDITIIITVISRVNVLKKNSKFHFSVVLQSIFSKHMKVRSFQLIVICKIFTRKNCEVQKHPDLDNGWKIETLTSPYWDFINTLKQHIIFGVIEECNHMIKSASKSWYKPPG